MREELKYLAFITVLHAVFFVMAAGFENIILPDSEDYIWQAENIKTEGSFYATDFSKPVKTDYFSKRPPLYALLVLVITTITGSLFGILFIQNILSILTAWLIYRLLKTDFKIPHAAGWSAGLWLIFPNQLLYANMVMSETLLQFLLVAAFYFFVRYTRNQQPGWIYLNVLCLSLALLTKPVMLYFWILNAVVLVILGIKYRQYFLPLPVLILPLIIVLWSEKNYETMGYRHYSSISHVNLKDYNTKYFLFEKYGSEYGDSVINVIDTKLATLPDYKARCEYIKDTCTRIILSDIPRYTKFHIKGMITFMIDPGRYDYVNFFAVPQGDGLGLLHYVSKGDMAELKQFLKTQPLWLVIVMAVQMLLSGLVMVLCFVSLFDKTVPFWPKLYLYLIIGYIWFITGPIGSAR
ncbi:MAG TPA: glycosyltransferase family 39 protein, partial [Bacteroidia bacterium]|nr:glycosyltransferase family 39 protein [Bacteroidia bacterium]